MADFFTDVFNALSGDEFEEVPVPIEEFVEDYLHHPPLSENQYKIIKASTQIYTKKTLVNLYGEEKGEERYKETFNEVICRLGKGAGKDAMARISCAYIVYLLLCLRDPQKYFGKPPNDAIDIMNIAVNADQANRVFFRQFVELIKGCEWFDGKYDAKRSEVNFIKNINLISGHSESESLEGYNVIVCILDEISGFADENNTGNKKAKTAEAIYNMHRASVDSRFPEQGKCIDKNALVWSNGLQTIEDLIANKVGHIMSAQGHARKVMGTYDDGVRAGLKITNTHGTELDVTHEHKLYVRNEDGFEGWKTASEITLDDYIAMSFNSEFGDERVSTDEAYALGLWVAEGSSFVHGQKYNQSTITLCGTENIMNRVLSQLSLWREQFAISSIHNNRKPCSVQRIADKNLFHVTIRGVDLERNWKNYYGIYSKNAMTKHVPKKIMGSPATVVAEFLRGLYDGDGWASNDGINLCTASLRLRNEVSALLWGLGIENTVRQKVTASGNNGYIVHICDPIAFTNIVGTLTGSESKRIGQAKLVNRFGGATQYLPGAHDELRRIANWLDALPGGRTSVGCQRIGRILSKDRVLTRHEATQFINSVPPHVSNELKRVHDSGIVWSKVRSIQASTCHRVDVEVEEDHSFIANGAVSHNCILLSFPRHQNDFITQRYNDVVAEKTVIERSKVLKLDPDLPDGFDGNEINVEWEEDHITRYRYPRMFAMSRPTWEVNPTKKIENFTRAFASNPADALARFAAQPTSGGEDAVFKNHLAIDETFVGTNGVDANGVFWNGMKPDPNKEYYIHVDLAQKHDRCAVAMAHVEKFVTIQMGGTQVKETHPTVKVDLIRWWQPSIEQSVDFKWVTDFIIQLSGMGFNIKLVTFDRWQSHDIRNFLEARGMKTASLSVGNDHYLDFMSIMYDQRLIGPDVPELKDELKKLRWIRGKIDHPRSGYKDLSDATAGAVYNAVTNTARPRNNVVEVHTLRDLYKQEREQKWEEGRNVIEPPSGDPKTMPSSLKEFMGRIL